MTNAPLCISMCLCSGDGRRELMYFLGVLSNMKDIYIVISLEVKFISQSMNPGEAFMLVLFLLFKTLWVFGGLFCIHRKHCLFSVLFMRYPI